jgi:maleylpyruvate isomerase
MTPSDLDLDPDAGVGPALAEMRAATDRLLDTVSGMTDADMAAPSLLPGWTRGHVLTHLARNAEALINLVTWASTGVPTPMYAGPAVRDTDIEAGAGRGAGEQLADLTLTAHRLDEAVAGMPPEAYERPVATSNAEFPGRDIPLVRVREIEIHHVDLAAGYTPAHWSPAFTARTLDTLAQLFRTARETPVAALEGLDTGHSWEVGATGPVLRGPETALLAWLTGRSNGEGLTVEPAGPIPPAPRWA